MASGGPPGTGAPRPTPSERQVRDVKEPRGGVGRWPRLGDLGPRRVTCSERQVSGVSKPWALLVGGAAGDAPPGRAT